MTSDDASAQPAGFNYDEAKVPQYELPDPLTTNDGRPVSSAEMWTKVRRPEVLELFQRHVYGRSPGRIGGLRFQELSSEVALDGQAIRRQVKVYFTSSNNGPQMELLIYLPNPNPPAPAAEEKPADAKPADSETPVAAEAKPAPQPPYPAFIGLNFNGNHTIHSDPGINLSKSWMRNNPERGIVDNQATEASRGTSSSRWPVEKILARGYALVTIYCGDIDPDFDDGFRNGVHPLAYTYGPAKPHDDQWGTIGAWAWGLSRALDYLEKDKDIDHQRVAVLGHSRLGKTSLWAGATDERFALVISNDSGCGGAALSRRQFGETVKRINTSFPHWFCDQFNQYNDNEAALPVDQHELIALMAPRPVYIASAEDDQWADPRGEFLSGKHASPVYELFGLPGLTADAMPAVDQPAAEGTIGYHIRTGKHDVTDYDWEQYLNFADRHLPKPAAEPAK
ncbi:MAG: acetylxylan esterase [Pirellulaceae bacterium]